jgi:hypothetical protein
VIAICADLFNGVYDAPSSEPLADCQWDMAIIDANRSAWSNATGEGVTVGVIDSGVDATHRDIAANLDLARSCSFIAPGTPTANPAEYATDCSLRCSARLIGSRSAHLMVKVPITANSEAWPEREEAHTHAP